MQNEISNSPSPKQKRRCQWQRLLFLRSLISHKNEHTVRRPRALEVECVKKTFQWNCAPKRATGSFPASCESKCAARSLSRQAHQTKKALLTWCLPYPGALEVECVKKTFQWNVFSTTVPSRKGERIARRLRGQAHQKKKAIQLSYKRILYGAVFNQLIYNTTWGKFCQAFFCGF